ncbi:MAG: ATP-binding cassette domain-containing protein [Nitrospira sp.]|nr:ATP-binding cassette domain-containing protein [Nitrospira sp.]
MTQLLKVDGLKKHFGEIYAVDGVNLEFQEGVFTSIIGPNGAGKTTFINLLTGRIFPDSGKIFFKGEDITRLPIHRRVKKGIGRSFQVTNILPRLTVFENIAIPTLARMNQSWNPFSKFRRLQSVKKSVEETLQAIGLLDKSSLLAAALSHGDQRLLEIGIAMASHPTFLILDEPTAGMNPVERVHILKNIKRLSVEQKVTFLIVEHDMDIVFSLSDRIIVLHRGKVLVDGRPEEIKEDRNVREVYLGEEFSETSSVGVWECGSMGASETSSIHPHPHTPTLPHSHTPTLLELRSIQTFYGHSHVLQGISLGIKQGEVVCLLGRNGVGKTTTLRSIMGLAPPRSGSIHFQGQEIVGKKPYEIAHLGIGYVPDDRRIFPELTVRQNLEMVRWITPLERQKGKGEKEEGWTLSKVYTLFPKLKELENQKGRHLSGGEQKMLAIGRALMSNPALLLLDEPSEGLSPLIVQILKEAIENIRREGVTILLADQNLKFARAVANRAFILEKGMVQYEGSLEDLWKNEEVVKKYLAI